MLRCLSLTGKNCEIKGLRDLKRRCVAAGDLETDQIDERAGLFGGILDGNRIFNFIL